jgi:mono/diheme cytochrome c family protein
MPPLVQRRAAALVAAVVTAGVAAAISLAFMATVFIPEHNMPKPNAALAVAVNGASLLPNTGALATQRGHSYYAQLCMSCHGPRGDGYGEWAYRVTPRPANLTSARVRRRSDSELLHMIAEGIPGTPMIGWKRQLSAAQQQQLVGYVRLLSDAARAKRPGASS